MNGYLVAEICSRYFPVRHAPTPTLSGRKFVAEDAFTHSQFSIPLDLQADIQMHGFQNGLSTPVKLDNWQQLQKFFNKRDLKVPKGLIDDTLKVRNNSMHEASAMRQT